MVCFVIFPPPPHSPIFKVLVTQTSLVELLLLSQGVVCVCVCVRLYVFERVTTVMA